MKKMMLVLVSVLFVVGIVFNSLAEENYNDNDYREMWIEEIWNCYCIMYGGDMSEWEQEELRSFQEAISISLSKDEAAALCIEMSSYPDIDEKAITPEDAFQIAFSEKNLEQCRTISCIYIGAEPNPIWKVQFYDKEEGKNYFVEIDSISGTIKNIIDGTSKRSWHIDIVTQETIDIVNRMNLPKNTRPSFG